MIREWVVRAICTALQTLLLASSVASENNNVITYQDNIRIDCITAFDQVVH